MLDVGRGIRLPGRAVAEAERPQVRLAAVHRDRRVKVRVRLVGGIAAVIADQERVGCGENAVVERQRAGGLHALPRLVRARADGQLVRHVDGRGVRRVAERADRHRALVHVERAEPVGGAVAVRRHARLFGAAEIVVLPAPEEVSRAAEVERPLAHLREGAVDVVHGGDGERRVRIRHVQHGGPDGIAVYGESGDRRRRTVVDERAGRQHEVVDGLHEREVRDARGAAARHEAAARREAVERAQFHRARAGVARLRIGEDRRRGGELLRRRRERVLRRGRQDERRAVGRCRAMRGRHDHFQFRAAVLHRGVAFVFHALRLVGEREFLRHVLQCVDGRRRSRHERVGAERRKAVDHVVRHAARLEEVELRLV